MFLKLAIILVVGGASIRFSDFANESSFYSLILPIVALLSLISLALWFVAFFHLSGIRQTFPTSSGSGDGTGTDGFGGFDGDSGGDGS